MDNLKTATYECFECQKRIPTIEEAAEHERSALHHCYEEGATILQDLKARNFTLEAVRADQCSRIAELEAELSVASKNWRVEAAAWLRRKADEQERTNREFPKHVEAYPSWVDRPHQFRWLAVDLEQEASKVMGIAK